MAYNRSFFTMGFGPGRGYSRFVLGMKQTSHPSVLRALFAVLLLTGIVAAYPQEAGKRQGDSQRRSGNLRAEPKRSDRGASALGGYLTRGSPQELRLVPHYKKTAGSLALPPRTNPTNNPQKPDPREPTQSHADQPKPNADEAGKGPRDDTQDDAKKKRDSNTQAGAGTKREVTAKDLIPFFQKGRPSQHGASGLVPFRAPVSDENLSPLLAPRSGANK